MSRAPLICNSKIRQNSNTTQLYMLDRNSFIADQRRVRRVFNSKLAIATAALIAVLAPSIYLVHRFQLAKVNRLLRQRSQDFREQSDYPNAIRYLDRYLRQRPDDLEAKIELAELMDKCAITIPEIESAIALQFTAIGLCDSSPELYSRLPKLRQRLIERLVEIGRFEDAMREIEPRIEKDPQPDLLRIIARCRMGLALEKRIDPYKTNTPFGKPEWYRSAISRDPVDLLLEALDANPGDFELNRLLAEVILNRSSLLNPSKLAALNAEDTQRLVWNSGLQMLATNPSSSDACALFLDIAATVDPDAAPPHFENALERFPDVAQIERAAGMFFLSRVTTDSRSDLSSEDDELLSRAEAILKKLANQKRSQDARVFAALGDIYSRRGNKDEAIRIWNLGCTTCQPPTLELHFRIAQSNLQGAAGDITFQSLNQLDRAIQRESISITPKRHREMIRGSKELWIRYYQANRDSAAIESLLSALASSTASEDSETRSETSEFIAFNYLRSKKWGKASIAFQQALAYKPGDARLLRGAAQASLRSNHLPDAIAYLQLIDDKTLDDWFFLASAILDAHLRQNGSSNPFPLHSDLGSALDALDHAKQLQSHDSTKGPEGWRLRLLEIELAICRANREERDLVLQSSTEEIVAMCEGAPGIQELWQSSIWVLRRWGQQEPLNRLMELFAS
ncbi:MAG: tetratricopeptide repeat protein, partial [Planctomycetes bacterium]|nr:tetratricopeptide repeat protein [Planctomycetota bacterium]